MKNCKYLSVLIFLFIVQVIKAQNPEPKCIHILVALCDNKYQGIVPVPKGIGNGQDPNSNLYWGCGYGIRTFFRNSSEWKLIRTVKKDSVLMERLVFKHKIKNYYLVADAYNGKYIRTCTEHLLRSCSGKMKDTVMINDLTVGINGNAQMLAYIGHDGLMDFQLSESFKNTDGKNRDCIILACYSRHFFKPHLQHTGANPVVWTTNLMCPEAYTIHDALAGYVNGETNEQVRDRAASAYAKYQKCSKKAARGLLVTGW